MSSSPSRTVTTTTRPTKKRLLESGVSALVQKQQVESLQAELLHERSLRQLDQKRHGQTLQRTQRKLELALGEARDLNELLQEERAASEQTQAALSRARNQALAELRETKIREQEEENLDGDYASSVALWQAKYQQSQELLQEREHLYEALQEEMVTLREQTQASLEDYRSLKMTTSSVKHVEEASPAILQELNKTRTELAQAQRQNRQLQRAHDSLKLDYEVSQRAKEKALLDAPRLRGLEEELHEARRRHDEAAALLQSWQDFGKTLMKEQSDTDLPADGGPPEALSVVHTWRQAAQRAEDYETRYHQTMQQVQQFKTELARAKEEVLSSTSRERTWQKERTTLEREAAARCRQVEHLQAQIGILEREAKGLRELIQTFDNMPVGADRLEATPQALTVDVVKAREQATRADQERDLLSKELEQSQSQTSQLQEELDRVKEKYYKLLDALKEAKEQASLAAQRAVDAERLAGKGSFDPNEIRVLHFRETPLTEAMREEIEVLKRQLEKQGKAHAPDPEKLNQRLKENFKEHISLFREGVYLMTGFKIDMLPGGSDRPTFRVRSVYQEREEDQLLLKWPKTSDVSSLDILNTDFAKTLASTPAYDYMSKFHSLPAFLASTQLSLFEKQTIVM